MSITDNVINTALLGTANRELSAGDLPEDLGDTLSKIKETAADGEDLFYKIAAAFFAYYRSGLEPLNLKDPIPVTAAEPETMPYPGKKAAALLGMLLGEKYAHMLLLWYKTAAERGYLIPAEYLPDVLERAFLPGSQTAKREKRLLASLIGNRGRWLLPLMNYPPMQEEGNEDWETATHADRKRILSRVRESDPPRGIELLRAEWKNEPAQHRAELLECLKTGLSKSDEEFLESVRVGDRSSTVRDTALGLLRRIPDSAIVGLYARTLKRHLHYRRLFGWSVDPVAYSDEFKKAGINEVSSNKGESDSDYILRQMAERVPLSFWSEILECDLETAAQCARKSPPFSKYIHLENAIFNFNDRQWAYYWLKGERVLQHPELLPLVPLLSVGQREELNLEGKAQPNFYVMQWLDENDEEWGEKFSRGVLKMIYSMAYCYYDRPTCEQLALRLPVSLLGYIGELGAAKENSGSHWEFTVRMQQLIQIKKDIQEGFTAEM
ncbi:MULTISPECIES: DUF5691 domain-containing protein [Butyricimonas]|uniref:DUF5691 domain-containing protein n=1 Tax=Butyricimonas TaxID=574697 RepID=UPI0007FB3CC2|nr:MULTISPECIES: DUF5691 domain-containing protein [Butyricimonas]